MVPVSWSTIQNGISEDCLDNTLEEVEQMNVSKNTNTTESHNIFAPRKY
jgi:hypothetical protein